MTNKKILMTSIIAIASILMASPIAMQSASAGGGEVYCSTDKNDPTSGYISMLVIEYIGDNCYVDGAVISNFFISEAGKVSIINSVIYFGIINEASDKIKLKDNYLWGEVEINDSNVSHLEVKDNSATNDGEINMDLNTTDILKIDGNTLPVSLTNNDANEYASCKNNTSLTGFGNDYTGRNKGCPVDA